MSRQPDQFYFAYGSNMEMAQMVRRCPQARRVGRGVARHRSFVINRRGVATLRPQRNAETWGGIWRITAADEAALDRFEGVAFGCYRKTLASIRLDGGITLKALVYIDPVAEDGEPRLGYLPRVVRGALDFRLPQTYVARIIAPFLRDAELAIAC
jgi:cation transport regulator ChaC